MHTFILKRTSLATYNVMRVKYHMKNSTKTVLIACDSVNF